MRRMRRRSSDTPPSRAGRPTAHGTGPRPRPGAARPSRRPHPRGRDRRRGSTAASRGVYPVLRALEEAGRIRRGYFVDGLGAAQFALPGAIDRLRPVREAPRRRSGPGSTCSRPPTRPSRTAPRSPGRAATTTTGARSSGPPARTSVLVDGAGRRCTSSAAAGRSRLPGRRRSGGRRARARGARRPRRRRPAPRARRGPGRRAAGRPSRPGGRRCSRRASCRAIAAWRSGAR